MNNEETFRSTLQRVSSASGFSESEILGSRRKQQIVEVKHIFRYLLYKSGINKRKIALLSGCNPGTVTSSIRTFENLYQTDRKFRENAQKNYSDLMSIRIKKPVYIIGKVTGTPYKECFQKFLAREKRLNQAGYIAVNPMRLVPEGTSWVEAMRICLGAMVQSYAVSPIDDWKDSRGGRMEMYLAQELKMNVIYKI